MKQMEYLLTLVLVLTAVNAVWFLVDRLYAKPSHGGGCDFYWCYDVNRCGSTYHPECNPNPSRCIRLVPPRRSGPAQCVLCRIRDFTVWCDEYFISWFYDCTGDGHQDCEYQRWWAVPKGFGAKCPAVDPPEE